MLASLGYSIAVLFPVQIPCIAQHKGLVVHARGNNGALFKRPHKYISWAHPEGKEVFGLHEMIDKVRVDQAFL